MERSDAVIRGASVNIERTLPRNHRLQMAPPWSDAESHYRISRTYENLATGFEINQGQTDSRVRFIARGTGYILYLTPAEAVLALNPSRRSSGNGPRRHSPPISSHEQAVPLPSVKEPAVLRMQLLGARPEAKMTGIEEVSTKRNYFIGNNPQKWHTAVPLYSKVRQEGIYPGVDLVYYRNHAQLEFDFIISPGADPGLIGLSFQGAETVALDAEGNLILRASGERIQLRRPLIYQGTERNRREIDGGFIVKDGNLAGFEVKAEYDRRLPLIIDPILSYSTYLGGSGDDTGSGIAVDRAGNSYVIGTTTSVDFPVGNSPRPPRHSYGDVFLTKINPTGSSIVYTTFIGGRNQNAGNDVAVDTSGNAYITGWTNSDDFPTAKPLQQLKGTDAFVAKLDPSGSTLVYSTYLGGSGDEAAYKIAVDPSGHAHVTGETDSTDFPILNAAQPIKGGGYTKDAFVAKLNAAGSALIYSTYLGGASYDVGNGIAVDTLGAAYVTGETDSTDFPVVNAFQPAMGGGSSDAFVTKLSPSGKAVVYSTYLGGTNADVGCSIAVEPSGRATVTGWTRSNDFPVLNGLQPIYPVDPRSFQGLTAFITRLDPGGAGLVYSTYLGGSDGERGTGIAVDPSGYAYVTGITGSVDFPVVNAIQPAPGESLILKSTDGAANWSPCSNGISIRRLYGYGFGIRSLAIDPTASNTLYAGTTLGVYKSSNGGRSWNPSSTGIPSELQVTFVAVSPTIPPTLFALGAARASEFAPRVGILRSTDGGGTWTASNRGFPTYETGAIYVDVSDIAIDSKTPTRVYAATSVGVYKSEDSGANWRACNAGLVEQVGPIAIDPLTPTTLYVATGVGVFKSTNGGDTWKPTETRLPIGNTIASLVTAAGPPSTLYVVAGVVYRTSDGGITWVQIASLQEAVTHFAVDPSTPTTLYAVMHHWLRKSVDGGSTWTGPIPGVGYSDLWIQGLVIDPASPSTIYSAVIGDSMSDFFVAKLNPSGSALIYSTFLGGRARELFASSIAVDAEGNAYVTGSTYSPDFPTATPIQATLATPADTTFRESYDAVVTKISSTIETNFAQFANGAGFVSSLVLTNPSRTDRAEGHVSFFNDNGQPLFLSMNGGPRGSTAAFSVPRLGTMRLSTDGAGDLISGSVRVRSNTPVAGVVEFEDPSLGTAGVGESAALVELMTPVANSMQLGLYTGIAISNPQSRDAEVNLSLRGLDGLDVTGGLISLRLPGYGHLAKFVNQLFPSAQLENFEGVMLLSNSSAIARVNATALQLGSVAGRITTLPVVALDPVPGSDELYFAQFGDGSNLSSSLFLTNPLSSKTSGEISFCDDEGRPLAVSINNSSPADRIPFSIEPYGGAVFSTSGQGDMSVGSARVVAGKALGGVLRFSIPGLGIAGVGASAPMTSFIAPVRSSTVSGIWTGVAITALESPVHMILTLRDRNGDPVTGGEVMLELGARGHLARFVHELFPGPNIAEFEGTLTVSAEGGKVAATAIELGSKPGQFTTLPVAELK